ncbi:MAG: EamA family transporter [Actinomycetales bacterium]
MFIALALGSTVLYGTWRFVLGRYSRRLPIWTIVLVSNGAAALVYVVVGVARGDLVFVRADVLPGVLGGVLNLGAVLLSLQAMRRGKLGVVTGITAMRVLVPLVFSFVIGEAISIVTAVGIVIMLIGLVLFASRSSPTSDGTRGSSAFVLFALGAALMGGLATVVLDLGSRANIAGTLTMSQVTEVLIVGVVMAVTRAPLAADRRAITSLAGAGVALAFGNTAFFTASGIGDIGIVAVLAALAPLVTAALAWILLKEHLNRSEIGALVVILFGTGLVLA